VALSEWKRCTALQFTVKEIGEFISQNVLREIVSTERSLVQLLILVPQERTTGFFTRNFLTNWEMKEST
jgi:hypothetical protein